ncbi:TetR/AcrR family transcriptional regulator [Streptomyces sp. B21-108]|uniref:TetR/AcrR family transcriptional regulator n=1 Tax=Streptomyces sp. B21-108 TaxID=3039419 RepID=UPI002FF2906D
MASLPKAQSVGVTVPALYYHHENKQAMLVALLERGMDEVLARARLADAEAEGRILSGSPTSPSAWSCT